MNKNISTFIGCESSFEEADIVLFGAPFDGTTSYRPGTRFGPSAIRNESYGLETYSPYQDKDLQDILVFDSGDLELPFGNTEAALKQIEQRSGEILDAGKIPLMLGGEHLVTLGSIRACVDRYPDLHVIHFDAHTDLRDQYLGERLSHSTVIRRVWELVGDKKIHQFGIRSGEREEFLFGKEHNHLQKFNLNGYDETIRKLGKIAVYVTIDLDVLDPGIMSGTGTPEAGGIGFNELLQALINLREINVVACDINELSPVYDNSGVSTAVACKLTRELLLALNTKSVFDAKGE